VALSGAGLAVVLLVMAGVRLCTVRSRLNADAPMTEAEARAHALPLSTSILSVGPRPRDPGGFDA
jgi:hypothetical protein